MRASLCVASLLCDSFYFHTSLMEWMDWDEGGLLSVETLHESLCIAVGTIFSTFFIDCCSLKLALGLFYACVLTETHTLVHLRSTADTPLPTPSI